MTAYKRHGLSALAAICVIAGSAAFAAPAMAAATAGEAVSGTTLSTLTLAATGAVFTTNFNPGGTALTTGALTATDTSGTWTLQAEDLASSNAGKMQSSGGTCTGSDAVLTNALTISITSPLGGVTPSSAITLSGSNQTVATGSGALLAASVLTTHYSQVIPSAQVMATGCIYSLTTTYTLQ
jgi:hypothetical protein